jgi:hypothetical protein
MNSDDERPPKTRKVISSTCALHTLTPGYCNLEVRREGGGIVLHPHVDGACVITFNEEEARDLHAWIGELLG